MTAKQATVAQRAAGFPGQRLEGSSRCPEHFQGYMADILHDLKNQAAAALQAVTQRAETETARLQQQLDARHLLDRVHAMICL